MKISFADKKLEKHFMTMKTLVKKYGDQNARKLARAIKEISSANTLQDVPSSIRPHPLSNNLKGYFAVDGKHPYRLLLRPLGDYDKDDFSTIAEIEVCDVIDYH